MSRRFADRIDALRVKLARTETTPETQALAEVLDDMLDVMGDIAGALSGKEDRE